VHKGPLLDTVTAEEMEELMVTDAVSEQPMEEVAMT
jgi:hypothetical protein